MCIVSININSGMSNFSILKVGSIDLGKKKQKKTLANKFSIREIQKTGMVMKEV